MQLKKSQNFSIRFTKRNISETRIIRGEYNAEYVYTQFIAIAIENQKCKRREHCILIQYKKPLVNKNMEILKQNHGGDNTK